MYAEAEAPGGNSELWKLDGVGNTIRVACDIAARAG